MTASSQQGTPQVADFDELAYLDLNPDVAQMVNGGQLTSGLHHFLHHGRHEGRLGPGYRPFSNRRVAKEDWSSRTRLLTVAGPLSSPSGLGRSARGCLQAALHLDAKSVGFDFNPYVPRLEEPGGSDRLFPTSKFSLWVVNGDVLPRIAEYVRPIERDHSISVAMWAWEMASAPRYWEAGLEAIDEVWAPSEFCAESFRLMSPLDVAVVPYVVEIPEFPLLDRGSLGLPEDAFIFLSMFDSGSYLSRKNPMAVIEAFKIAFGTDPRFHLLLKAQSTPHYSIEMDDLSRQCDQSNISLVVKDADDVVNYSLKNCCDCFVSAHRSEGFGLNVAEAMLLRKPVIATDYSATAEYLTQENGFPLEYDLCTVRRDTGPYQAGGVWAEPKIDRLAELMRQIVDEPQLASSKAVKAQATILERFSAETVARTMSQRMEILSNQLQADGSLPPRHPLPRLAVPESQVRRMKSDLSGLPFDSQHRVSVICPVYNVDPGLLLECVDSVRAQTYANWELCLVDDHSTREDTRACLASLAHSDRRIRVLWLKENHGIARASNRAVEISTGAYIALLDNDDVLAPNALEVMLRSALNRPDVALWYSDEDKIDSEGRLVDPYFKPDWSPEHLESCMYLLHLMMMRKDVFLKLGGFRNEFSGAQDYDLALRFSLAELPIGHVPDVLYHWRMIPGSSASEVDAKPEALDRAKDALTDYARCRYGLGARVEAGRLHGLWRVRMEEGELPPMTVVIPSNDAIADIDGRGQIELLTNALTSIRDRTEYPDMRLLIVDNGTVSEARRRELDLDAAELISYRGSQSSFNFADKINFAVENVKTEHFVILNDDIEVLTAGWLTALAEIVSRKGVGAVGARLLTTDGRIQHVGVVGGLNGSTAHIYHGADASTVGHNGYAQILRNYSMVTGACMASRSSVWRELNGFDRAFATDFNDVDYCLRLLERGYRVAYTPFAELVHFEGQTISRQRAAEVERIRFLERWRMSTVLSEDPYFNRNFSKFHLDLRPSHSYEWLR